MSALVAAIADFGKDFLLWRCVAYYRSSSSSPKFLWFRRLRIASRVFSTFYSFKKEKRLKTQGYAKLLNNNKKEDAE